MKDPGKIPGALIILAGAISFVGCRGGRHEDPPIHPNPHMDTVPRFDPQEENPFFRDGMAMRPLVPGTVARGHLRADAHRYEGKVDGALTDELPMPVSQQLLERGRERYEIFCAPCHDGAGYGQGVVAKRGLQPPPSNLHEQRLRELPLGHLFDVITHGVRNMPAYNRQIPPDDRWAIAAYVRALQLSQNARLEDVPEEVKTSKGWTQ